MTERIPAVMRAVRLHRSGGPTRLVVEQVATPRPAAGEALVRVHAAAITPDELDWPTDRLPAIPSYEFSGVVVAVAGDVEEPWWWTPSAASGCGDRRRCCAVVAGWCRSPRRPPRRTRRPRGGSPRSTSW